MLIHIVSVGPGLAGNSQVMREQRELVESVTDRGQQQGQQLSLQISNCCAVQLS
jgi:hypothetical protein